MTTPTPETNLLIGELVQNSGFNWTSAEVQRIAEHAIRLERERDEWKSKFNGVTNYICLRHTDSERGELVTGCPICKLAQLRKVVDAQHQTIIHWSREENGCCRECRAGSQYIDSVTRINHVESCEIGNTLAAYNELPHVKNP